MICAVFAPKTAFVKVPLRLFGLCKQIKGAACGLLLCGFFCFSAAAAAHFSVYPYGKGIAAVVRGAVLRLLAVFYPCRAVLLHKLLKAAFMVHGFAAVRRDILHTGIHKAQHRGTGGLKAGIKIYCAENAQRVPFGA